VRWNETNASSVASLGRHRSMECLCGPTMRIFSLPSYRQCVFTAIPNNLYGIDIPRSVPSHVRGIRGRAARTGNGGHHRIRRSRSVTNIGIGSRYALPEAGPSRPAAAGRSSRKAAFHTGFPRPIGSASPSASSELRYDVYVRPGDGPEQAMGVNLPFRTRPMSLTAPAARAESVGLLCNLGLDQCATS